MRNCVWMGALTARARIHHRKKVSHAVTRFLEMISGYFNKNDVPGNLIPGARMLPVLDWEQK